MESVRIVHSDFKRTKETAQLFAETVGAKAEHVYPNILLRERNFGELELGDHARYKEVWAEDENDATHHTFDAESPAEVPTLLLLLLYYSQA